MAFQSLWFSTRIPDEIINLFEKDMMKSSISYSRGQVYQVSDEGEKTNEIRSARNCELGWLNTDHWIAPFLWFYIEKANRTNFKFDIECIDSDALQYTSYGPGQHYGWHVDDNLGNALIPTPIEFGVPIIEKIEKVRKISFSLQLSDPADYEGGELQILGYDTRMYQVPKEKGLLVCFDSTSVHRVRPVKSGLRKSLVGWVMGPRWR